VKAVSIWDLDERGVLAIDLVDVLELAGPDAIASLWQCNRVEAIGVAAVRMHAISDGPLIRGKDLLAMARDVHQVVDGEFTAVRMVGNDPWLIVRAVDSTQYAVVTDSDDLLVRLRSTFKDVRDSPGDVAP
jgi:hypothetical protein